MAEFKIAGTDYKSRKLNTFEQLFIVKRLTGAFNSALGKDLIKAVTTPNAENSERDPMKYLTSFSDAFSKMPEDDFIYIINTCFRTCTRFSNGVWSPLMSGDVHMFQDITAAQTLQIVYNVLMENLSSFFVELLSILGLDQETK